MALNYEHLARAWDGNTYSIRLYFLITDYDTDYESSRRQLSFDASYAIHDYTSFHKLTPKVRLYPSLTSTLGSILRPLNRKGFELIRRKKDLIAFGIISRNASACEALREIISWSERWKKRRELNRPSFYRPLIC